MKKNIFLLTISALLISGSLFAQKIKINYPGKKWAVTLNANNFSFKKNIFRPFMRYAILHDDSFTISITIEKAPAPTAKECREIYWNRIKRLYNNAPVNRFSIGKIAVLDYFIHSYRGFAIKQKHINAFLVRDGLWIDIHISKTLFKKKDSHKLVRILKSITYTEEYIASSYENLSIGNAFFYRRLPKKAIPFYKKALSAKPTLSKRAWVITIDNLGMAYGISGDIKKAQTHFAKAIKKMPTYPTFHYNIACSYGEKKNYKMAAKHLRLAFKYRHNLLSNARLPHPGRDSSFRYFRKMKKFRKLIQTLAPEME